MARTWDELDRGQFREEDTRAPETLSDGLYDRELLQPDRPSFLDDFLFGGPTPSLRIQDAQR